MKTLNTTPANRLSFSAWQQPHTAVRTASTDKEMKVRRGEIRNLKFVGRTAN